MEKQSEKKTEKPKRANDAVVYRESVKMKIRNSSTLLNKKRRRGEKRRGGGAQAGVSIAQSRGPDHRDYAVVV